MDLIQEMCYYPCGGGLFANSKTQSKKKTMVKHRISQTDQTRGKQQAKGQNMEIAITEYKAQNAHEH